MVNTLAESIINTSIFLPWTREKVDLRSALVTCYQIKSKHSPQSKETTTFARVDFVVGSCRIQDSVILLPSSVNSN